jgi:hypothetical protein
MRTLELTSIGNITLTKTAMHWGWKAVAAGVCGAAAHTSLMLLKSWSGFLPSFQPYESLQNTITHVIGTDIHPIVPWMLSFVSGATIIGVLFGRIYTLLPGKTAAIKGLNFGLLGWMVMGLLFFPIIGMGLFAIKVGLGIAPALFSLAMLLTYSIVMALAYAALDS